MIILGCFGGTTIYGNTHTTFMSYSQPLCWCSVGVWTVVLVGNLPRWSECSMVTYGKFWRLYKHMQYIYFFTILYKSLWPNGFDRLDIWPCFSQSPPFVSKNFPPQLYQYGSCFQVLSTAKPLFRWRMNWHCLPPGPDMETFHRPGSTSCMAKWAMQWMWGSKRWAKRQLAIISMLGSCRSVSVRMCGEIRRPSHGRYGTWTV